jgi:hypothetical protein
MVVLMIVDVNMDYYLVFEDVVGFVADMGMVRHYKGMNFVLDKG